MAASSSRLFSQFPTLTSSSSAPPSSTITSSTNDAFTFKGWPVKPLDSTVEQRYVESVISSIVNSVLLRENIKKDLQRDVREIQREARERKQREGKSIENTELNFGTLPKVEAGPDRVRSFKDVKLIGQGTYGEVFSTYDTTNNRTVVVKRIQKDKVGLETINNEVSILSYLKDYCEPYLLCYLDFFEDKTDYYLVTEYLGNYVELDKLINDNMIQTADDKMEIIQNLIDGLRQLHMLGVAHRDIKPDNILIDKETLNIKYIDFGFACYGESCITRKVLGSPYYMAPELFYDRNGIPYSLSELQKSDIWSLGITIFEVLTGNIYYEQFFGKYIYPELKNKVGVIADNIRTNYRYRTTVYVILLNEMIKNPMSFPLTNMLEGDNKYFINLLSRMLEKDFRRRDF